MGRIDSWQSKFLGSLLDFTIHSFNFQSVFHASAKLTALNLPTLLNKSFTLLLEVLLKTVTTSCITITKLYALNACKLLWHQQIKGTTDRLLISLIK